MLDDAAEFLSNDSPEEAFQQDDSYPKDSPEEDSPHESLPTETPPALNTLFLTTAPSELIQTVSKSACIEPASNEATVLQADVAMLNLTTVMILKAWSTALTVKSVIDLASMTHKHLKERRDIMKMSYGRPNYEKTSTFEVLD